GLWELEQRYSGHVDRLRRLHLPETGKAERILRDHQRIVDAIARRDVAGAQEALREHLSGTLSQVAEICERYPDYVKRGWAVREEGARHPQGVWRLESGSDSGRSAGGRLPVGA